MKKTIAMILCVVMLLSLMAGCGNNTPSTPSDPDPAAPSDPTPAAPAEDEKEAWPAGKLTLYVPGEAGNPVDLSARCWMEAVVEFTGADFEIVNEPTGDGERLLQQLKKADPDGCTLFYGGMGQVTQYYTGLHADNPADPASFTTVCTAIGLNKGGDIIFTQPDAPYNTIEELVDYVKANPGKVTCALSSGTTRYIVMVNLLKTLGIYEDLRIIEATAAETTAGLLGGTINIAAMGDQFAPQYLAENSLKAILLLRNDRNYDDYIDAESMPAMDAIPILPDYDLEECYQLFPMVIFGPAGMSDELCQEIADTMSELASDEQLARIKEQLGGSNSYTNYSHAEAVEIVTAGNALIADMMGGN